MEQFTYNFKTNQTVTSKVHVGVVGSGDLEILMFPPTTTSTIVKITTGSDGFAQVWEQVLARFFERYPLQADIVINDFGATPGVVNLRLAQAMEDIENEE